MDCIIIDDESTSRTILRNLCSGNKHLNIIQEFDNVEDTLKYLEEKKVDLILLDLHMEGLSGFDLIDRLNSFNLSNFPQIIITTMDEKLAFKGFEYNCTDYLLKPINRGRFKKAINKARKKYLFNSNFILVKSKKVM